MKKIAKRLSLIVAMVAALAMMVCGLAACSESAEIKEVYTAKGAFSAPEGEYGVAINTSSSVTLYTDGTYELVVVSNGYMAAYGYSQVMQSCVISCGTYTFENSADDEEVATLKLSKPTRIVSSSVTGGTTGAVYFDTADEATFEGMDKTAAEVLEAGKEFNLTVNPVKKTITSGLN